MSAAKKTTYKVICISLYDWDIEALDEMVAALKERGLAKVSRSWLIRHALDKVNIEAISRQDVYGE